jgi:hypothetical protein
MRLRRIKEKGDNRLDEKQIGIVVGNVFDKQAMEEFATILIGFVTTVFREGYNNHMDQETIAKALTLINALPPAPTNNTVSDCSVRIASKEE